MGRFTQKCRVCYTHYLPAKMYTTHQCFETHRTLPYLIINPALSLLSQSCIDKLDLQSINMQGCTASRRCSSVSANCSTSAENLKSLHAPAVCGRFLQPRSQRQAGRFISLLVVVLIGLMLCFCNYIASFCEIFLKCCS